MAARIIRITLRSQPDKHINRIDRPSLKNIVNDIIDRPEAMMDDSSRFAVMVQNSDPSLQKMFQVFARQEGFPPEFSEILKKLEQSVRPIPWVYVQQALAEERVPFEWVSVDRNQLGVGSLAQTHRARIKMHNQIRDVVARVIKPFAREKIEAGRKTLDEVAQVIDRDPILKAGNFFPLRPYVQQIYSMALSELNLVETTKNQNSGRRAYNKTLNVKVNGRKIQVEIYVPEVIEIPENARLMVQEFVKAISFEKHLEKYPDLNRAILETFSRQWLSRALIGETRFAKVGYFHADPHYGNILFSDSENLVKMYPIDHGMGGQMERSYQKAFISFVLAVMSQQFEFISRAMWAMRDAQGTKISLADFNEAVHKKATALRAENTSMAPSQWLTFAGNNGLVFPEIFAMFSRGIAIMFRNLESVNSPMNLQRELIFILAKHPLRMLSLIVKSELFSLPEWYRIVQGVIQNRGKGGSRSGIPSYLSSKLKKQVEPTANHLPLRCEHFFSAPAAVASGP